MDLVQVLIDNGIPISTAPRTAEEHHEAPKKVLDFSTCPPRIRHEEIEIPKRPSTYSNTQSYDPEPRFVSIVRDEDGALSAACLPKASLVLLARRVEPGRTLTLFLRI
jgi:hypothetical protein